MGRRVKLALLAAVAILCTAATPPPAKELVERARERNALNPSGARAKVRFRATDKDGVVRERLFTTASRKIGGRLHTVLRFSEPAEVAGVAMLVVENPGAAADQSLFLPKLRRVRKVAAQQRGEKFVGTDLTYADLAGTGLVEGAWENAGEEKVEGQPAWVLAGAPTGEGPYGRVKVWVHQGLFVTLKAEFFDRGGALVKTYEVKRLKEIEPGRYVAMESVVRSVAGSSTEVLVLELDPKATLADDEFTERALER